MGERISKEDRDTACPEVPRLRQGEIFTTRARRFDKSETVITLKQVQELGRGAFGVVNKMMSKEEDNPQSVPNLCAVKVPGGDGSLAEIELYLLLKLRHPNVVGLEYYFNGIEGRETMIQIVLELIDGGDLFHYLKKNYSKTKGIGVMFEVFSYQVFRGLAYCHSQRVCHRDIKPENLLINSATGVIKIADFGCGAELNSPDETHTFYIGTRIFRAPELLLGATRYGFKVDVWSMGVVMTEMALGIPLFYGRKGPKGHLLNIFEYLDIPTDEEFADMQAHKIALPTSVEHKSLTDRVRMHPSIRNPDLLLQLLREIFVYSPFTRISAWEACDSQLFDPLATLKLLPNGQPVPPLYNFSHQEVASMPESVRRRLASVDSSRMMS